jgi:hypothetical protein
MQSAETMVILQTPGLPPLSYVHLTAFLGEHFDLNCSDLQKPHTLLLLPATIASSRSQITAGSMYSHGTSESQSTVKQPQSLQDWKHGLVGKPSAT